MTTRSLVFALAAGALGFLLGTLTGALQLVPVGPLQRENAALREQVRLYEQLIDNYRKERTEFGAAAAQK
jgi:hypothetical protein